ncbi:transglutaminase family protein [Noviherbaspirillum galbum]|uniref:Transglutaminase family protein n=1 Tax=Noviherbaspirillum galbum TaxID=2709383 RepID=A0A6B3SSV8_9BURK|nr:transglutaminase family protein [Noviherbaspirillum galbum]NEX60699.1 transglutaminase family protein [Noviherbaspirillum galbum]
MLLSIRHETVYRYTAPQVYTIQQLRLTPAAEPHQRVHSWHIDAAGKLNDITDAYGNIAQMLTITGPHDEVRIVAGGVVEVMPLDRGRLLSADKLSPLVYTVPTRLTEADEAVLELAASQLKPHAGRFGSDALLALAEAIRGRVVYQGGVTGVTTSAANALRLGAGVCQDHAHLFLACCRAHGIPARYVSGYIDAGDLSHVESHAWADAWVEEDGFAGWVSIDITHARFSGEAHCRVAIGRDYDSAAPVRGVRTGSGLESLHVQVDVSSLHR